MPSEPLIRALSVTEAGAARIPLAGGVRAGHWVFLTGLLPDDPGDPQRLPGLPLPIVTCFVTVTFPTGLVIVTATVRVPPLLKA